MVTTILMVSYLVSQSHVVLCAENRAATVTEQPWIPFTLTPGEALRQESTTDGGTSDKSEDAENIDQMTLLKESLKDKQ